MNLASSGTTLVDPSFLAGMNLGQDPKGWQWQAPAIPGSQEPKPEAKDGKSNLSSFGVSLLISQWSSVLTVMAYRYQPSGRHEALACV